MKFMFYNFIDLMPPEDIVPKIGIYWIHFNPKPDSYLEERNRVRKRLGMSRILDLGHYFDIQLWIGNRRIGMEIVFREPKHEKSETQL